ncbi:hypothetical protein, partial [Nioella nitratireducens]|uniref:hypothetical protein n=1 Tax=Nioella nitratireducens TaxID=1287720 RepID=UPI001F433D9A
MAKHTILGGKVHVYRRENSRYWQCSTFLQSKNHRTTTKEESLAAAKEFAEDWYLTLRGKQRAGELITEHTFSDAAVAFQKEYEVITEGERSSKWVEGHKARIRLHLMPFFAKMGLSQIKAGAVQDYRVERIQNPANDKSPAYSTLHDEIVTLRLVLKTAIRKGWLDHLPDLSAPYRASGKVVHRAWFSPDEYRQLYTATRANIGPVAVWCRSFDSIMCSKGDELWAQE